MRIAVMQPTYLPWMGYFDLIDRSDIFVFYDDIPFSFQTWQQRNKVKTTNGEKLLTVPVKRKNIKSNLILDIEIDAGNKKWTNQHFQIIRQAYNQAPYYESIHPFLQQFYSQDWRKIMDLNCAFILEVKERLGLKTEIRFSSELKVSGGKTDKLIAICQYLGADEYLSPVGSFDYIEKDNKFPESGVQLWYQHFEHPLYNQLYGEFVSHLSILDLLCNEGENSLDIIRRGQGDFYSHQALKEIRPKQHE